MNIDEALKLPTKRETLVALGERAREKAFEGSQLSPGEEILLNVSMFLAEIRNGGFDQYFWNSSGDNAHETVKALTNIHAFKVRDLLYAALQLFPNGTAPKDRMKRAEILEQRAEETKHVFDDLNAKFLGIQDEDYISLLFEFAAANRDQFTAVPQGL